MYVNFLFYLHLHVCSSLLYLYLQSCNFSLFIYTSIHVNSLIYLNLHIYVKVVKIVFNYNQLTFSLQYSYHQWSISTLFSLLCDVYGQFVLVLYDVQRYIFNVFFRTFPYKFLPTPLPPTVLIQFCCF